MWKRFLSCAALATVLLAVSACQTTTAVHTAPECKEPDNINRVLGDGECLVIHTSGQASENTTLLVFLHGDGSRGGSSSYFYDDADQYGKKGLVAVAMIRPGYFDGNGQHSTGTSYRKEGDGYRSHIVSSVANAIETLKKKHHAQKVIVVGHSGGAAITGVILGKYPNLVDRALLLACPCDVPQWRIKRRGRNTWTRSLSPHNFTDSVKAGKVIAVTGTNDNNTYPVLAEEYVQDLTQNGVSARFVSATGKSHNSVVTSAEAKAALDELLQ